MGQLDYQEYADSLQSVGAEFAVSESHGMLCGLLCAGGPAEAKKLWRELLLPQDVSADNAVIKSFDQTCAQVFDETKRQINHETLDFHLLLVAEADADLLERTESLANWCQGYVYGLGIGGFRDAAYKGTDVPELVRDFSEISRAGYDDFEPDEEELEAFSELEEYVRVGVLLINETLQPVKQPQPIVH